jgi:hypothetical protein
MRDPDKLARMTGRHRLPCIALSTLATIASVTSAVAGVAGTVVGLTTKPSGGGKDETNETRNQRLEGLDRRRRMARATAQRSTSLGAGGGGPSRTLGAAA